MTRKPLAQPPPEEDPKQDVRELVRCMYSLDRELNRLNKDLAKVHSINPRSIYIMAQIRSGHNRPAELARHFGVLPSAITFEVDKLVAAKLVRRDQNPTDRRSVVLSVTAKGGSGGLSERRRRTHNHACCRDYRQGSPQLRENGDLPAKRVFHIESPPWDPLMADLRQPHF